MSHSPAPWRWTKLGDYEYPNMPHLISGEEYVVLDLGDNTEYYPTEGTPPSDADADLICAAPDLLAACKLALEFDDCTIRGDHYYAMDEETRSTIQAAIDKAEGK